MTNRLENRIPIVRRRRRRRRAQVASAAVGGAAAGAGLAFLLDPASGRRRRKRSVERVARSARRSVRRTARAGRRARSTAYGLTRKARHRGERPKDLDDVTLARKVETVVFRDPAVPKGQIDVNVQRGLVQLRGEVPTAELLRDLVEQTGHVKGVRDVENLLHLPGEPAQMHR